MFTSLCNEVGLSIKTSKNKEGRVTSFAGVELDTENMVIRLPAKKLLKAQSLVQDALAKKVPLPAAAAETYRIPEFCFHSYTTWPDIPPLALQHGVILS